MLSNLLMWHFFKCKWSPYKTLPEAASKISYGIYSSSSPWLNMGSGIFMDLF
jgi:hypothetical protein